MRKPHAFALSGLVAAAAVTGCVAGMRTVHLGAASTGPAAVSARAVAAQQAKLTRWSGSLHKALTAKPPALPAVPHYAPVAIPAVPTVRAFASAPAVRRVIVHRTIGAPTAKQHLAATTTTVAAATPTEQEPVVTYVQAPTTTWRSDDDRGGGDDHHGQGSGRGHGGDGDDDGD